MSGGLLLTYDHEGRVVAPGHRGASLAPIGEGPHALVLRARTDEQEIALKIQKERSPDTCVEAEQRWRREHEDLVRFGGQSPGLVGIVPLPEFESEDEIPRFEPLVLCRETGGIFHLPCPRCMRMHRLGDCRDDDVLGGAGLPGFSTSPERFLWCGACGSEQPLFYARRERPGPNPVRDFVALVNDLRSVVDRGDDETPLDPAVDAELTAEFPCYTCPDRAVCYPRSATEKGLAGARLTPVSLHEFHAWPLPLLQLRYDEAVDHLSGADEADLVRQYGNVWTSPAIRRVKEEALRAEPPPDAMHALAAKLDLYIEAVRTVHDLHVRSERPHLGISPEHVLVRCRRDGRQSVRLVAPGGPRPVRDQLLPRLSPLAPYAPASQVDERIGTPFPARIHIEKVWASGEDTFFRARIQGDGLPLDARTEMVRLTLNDTGWEGVEIWGHPLPGTEVSAAKGLTVATTPEPLDESQVNDLRTAKGQAPVFGTLTIYRSFGVPFDVHGLGMLLFRTLLVNETQSWEQVVDELVRPVGSSLDLLAATRPDATLHEYRQMLVDELGRPPADRLASRRNVWRRPDEVDAETIPEDPWLDLLVLAFRAVTHIPGFSICESDHEDTSVDPGGPTFKMLGALELLQPEVAEVLENLPVATPAPVSAPPHAPAAPVADILTVSPVVDAAPRGIHGGGAHGGGDAGALQSEVERLRAEVDRLRRGRAALEDAWARVYEGIVGFEDRDPPPDEESDGRIALIAACAGESIECITQVFKGIAAISGDELGETAPKIRMMIQDALLETVNGTADPEKRVEKIRRQFRALRMFLYAVVQLFIEANAHSTKRGTKGIMDIAERTLFEPVRKGKREKPPDIDELRRRFEKIRNSVAEQHRNVFQPFFQEYVRRKLSQLG